MISYFPFWCKMRFQAYQHCQKCYLKVESVCYQCVIQIVKVGNCMQSFYANTTITCDKWSKIKYLLLSHICIIYQKFILNYYIYTQQLS